MVDRKFLGNVATHGKAHHMGGIDAGVVEHVDCIVGHIRQRVAGWRHARSADAAVVENDRAEFRCEERQLPRPEV